MSHPYTAIFNEVLALADHAVSVGERAVQELNKEASTKVIAPAPVYLEKVASETLTKAANALAKTPLFNDDAGEVSSMLADASRTELCDIITKVASHALFPVQLNKEAHDLVPKSGSKANLDLKSMKPIDRAYAKAMEEMDEGL